MIRNDIEVVGYRNNVDKAVEQAQKGYITVAVDSLDAMAQTLHLDGPAVFMMVVPAETVEDTINELLHYCVEGDIVIDHGNSNFKDSRRRALALAERGIEYIDCGTSGGVYGLDRGYCLMVGGSNHAVASCRRIFNALAPGVNAAIRTDPDSAVTSAEHGWLHCGGPGAGHFVKMVHNGVEYGIMQAYAEGF